VQAAAGAGLPGWPVTIHDDLASTPRVLEIERPGIELKPSPG